MSALGTLEFEGEPLISIPELWGIPITDYTSPPWTIGQDRRHI